MTSDGERLLEITKGCAESMHEPDEEGLRVVSIVGDHLDNSFGERISEKAIKGGYQEYVITLKRGFFGYNREKAIVEYSEMVESFNLANLIALARVGASVRTEK